MKTFPLFRCFILAPLAVLLLAVSNSAVSACPACYGDTTGSKMGVAADYGIIAMVIIMLCMLSAIGAFMYYLAYRAKHPLPDYSELLSEDEGSPQPEVS